MQAHIRPEKKWKTSQFSRFNSRLSTLKPTHQTVKGHHRKSKQSETFLCCPSSAESPLERWRCLHRWWCRLWWRFPGAVSPSSPAQPWCRPRGTLTHSPVADCFHCSWWLRLFGGSKTFYTFFFLKAKISSCLFNLISSHLTCAARSPLNLSLE